MIPGIQPKTLLALLFLCCFTTVQAQLTVSSAPTPAQLVTNILLGPGVSASNITYSGGATARGSFSCAGACNVGIANGILLTSGAVTNAIGPNNATGSGSPTGAGSDPDLNLLNPGGSNPQDAAILQFDFTVATDSVRFRYVWASEEYHDYVGTTCNDVFGFFINGPGIVGKRNIALIPGTTTPITINNVNNGNAPGGTSPNGPCTNCAYFLDNTGGTTVQYDGMTTVLTAATQVCPCETYHIKLAVEDFCDGAFDSGVFLEGNSFQSVGEIPVMTTAGQYTQQGDTLYICPGDSIQLAVNACRAPLWSTGDTTTSIWVTQPGIYYTSIANPPLCFAFSALIYVQFTNPAAVLSASGPTDFCPGDSVVLTATPGLSYQWSNGATSQSITVYNPGSFHCTVSFGGNCSDITDTITVNLLSGLTLSINPSGPTTFCQGGSVTLTASSSGVLWSNGSTTQSITVNTAGTYTVTPTAPGFCPSPTSVSVSVNPNPAVSINGQASICQGSNTILSTSAPFSQYLWSGGQNTATISAGTSGTYTVTVTDANGCTATNNFSLNVLANPVPVISGDFDFCLGTNSVLSAGNGYSSYAWSTGSSTSTTNVSLPGTYHVTVTDANGCSGSASQLIVVFNPPLPFISGVTAICQGANANLIANPSGMTYLWSNGAVSSSIQPSVSGSYTVTVTDGNGCTGTVTQAVNVNSNPLPVISGNLSACQGSSSILSAGSGFSSYAWSDGSSGSSITVNSSGTYAVTVTDANGCSGTTSVNFTALPFTPAVVSGPAGFCTGSNAIIDAGSGYASYQWSTGGSGRQIQVSTGGTYTVTVTAANGCSGSSSFSINAWALPVPQISGVTAVCQGAAANLQAAPAGMSYLWSNGSTAGSIQPATAGVYTLTVTDNNGCSASTAQTVTVNNNPLPVITGTFTVCQGTSGLLDANQPGIASYAWSNGAVTAQIQPTVSGVYTVIVTDLNGCTGTTSQNLTVNPLPMAAINGAAAFCTGDNVTLSSWGNFSNYLWSNGATAAQIVIVNGGTYVLTVTDNNGCSGSASYSVTENPLPQPQLPANTDICDGASATLQPGTFTSYVWSNGSTAASITVNNSGSFTVTVSDLNGCSNSTAGQVTWHANPVPAITGLSDICDGQSAVLNAGSGYVLYTWSNGGSGAIQTVSAAGNYSVTVTDLFGCTGSALFDLQVHPLPLVAITGDLDICSGDSTRLETPGGQGSYLWSNGSTDPFIQVKDGGIYTVTVTTANGCSSSRGVTLNEHPLPVASYNPNQNITCEEIRIKFENTSTYETGSTFTWNFGDGGTSAEKSPSHVYALPGEYNTTLFIESPTGCTDDEAMLVSVVIPPFPEAEFGQSARIVSVFNSEVSFNNQSVNSTRYKWSFGDGQSSEEVNPSHVFDQVGSLKIKLIAFNGVNCYDEYETNLEVVPFFVPNAFTPNNDGKNDVFFDGTPVLNVQSYDMLVFNRWGQLVYTTDSFFRPWDGNGRDGNSAPEGLYTYLIKITSIKGKYYEYTGTFSLIR
ncbi:MAG: choice-of-anchor L domain-containing protein [Bacteroidia bacterium]|nr:choice-of-anchor L domain-containing protein [Bacteroidia bacterium]